MFGSNFQVNQKLVDPSLGIVLDLEVPLELPKQFFVFLRNFSVSDVLFERPNPRFVVVCRYVVAAMLILLNLLSNS